MACLLNLILIIKGLKLNYVHKMILATHKVLLTFIVRHKDLIRYFCAQTSSQKIFMQSKELVAHYLPAIQLHLLKLMSKDANNKIWIYLTLP
jgi:hypothetical protein